MTRQVKKKHKTARFIGTLVNDYKHAIWKYGNLKTMEELFEKGALNQSQIELLHERGIDIRERFLIAQLSNFDLEKDEDFIKFTQLAKEHPDALQVMNKLEKQRKRAETKQQNQELEQRIRNIDMDTPAGMQEFAALAKDNPKAFQLLEKLEREG